jgi:hypothetical protein
MDSTKVVSATDESVTIQITVPYGKSMLSSEEIIQQKLNEAGMLATGKVLERFDTDGSPIMIGDTKWTSKGKTEKSYQTAYGEVAIERHVYQSPKGGRIFCPLERDARIILTATPRFSKILSSKYSEFGSTRVIADLENNHGRKVARSFVQNVCDAIGAVAFAKEEDWNYEVPKLDKPVKTVAVGLDGTCMLITEDGFRETMVGTIAMYDKDGERLHTIYTSAAPEYGKTSFLARLDQEVNRIKNKFPTANYVGLADGARANWEFLNACTEVQLVDFWHAAGYLGRAAEVMFQDKDDNTKKKEWLETSCHDLKHKHRAAGRLLSEIEVFQTKKKLKKEDKEEVEAVVTYLTNNKGKMNYASAIEQNLPIGSGVTEAACKVIVKQRLCGAGMKWGERGAAIVLSLRSLNYTVGRWDQFWGKIDQYGFPLAA